MDLCHSLVNTFKKYLNLFRFQLYAKDKPKIFCIGRNKTGTTSMAAFLEASGVIVADQRPGELMLHNWATGEFEGIVRFARTRGQAFQDIPFSLPGTYKILHQHFPRSKFILTVRDSPEAWYRSLTSYHARLFGSGKVPSKEDLKRADYVYPGWAWEANRLIYGTPENDLYNEEIMKRHYEAHNRDVKRFFKEKPGKLLVVNVKEKDTPERIGRFLGLVDYPEKMPWKNRTIRSVTAKK